MSELPEAPLSPDGYEIIDVHDIWQYLLGLSCPNFLQRAERIRDYLHDEANIGVVLAPERMGSALVDWQRILPLFKRVYGNKSGQRHFDHATRFCRYTTADSIDYVILRAKSFAQCWRAREAIRGSAP